MHPWDRDEDRLDSLLHRYLRRLDRRDPRGPAVRSYSGDGTPPASYSLPSTEPSSIVSSPLPPPTTHPSSAPAVPRMPGSSQSVGVRSQIAAVPPRSAVTARSSHSVDVRSQFADVPPYAEDNSHLVEQALESAQEQKNQLSVLCRLQADLDEEIERILYRLRVRNSELADIRHQEYEFLESSRRTPTGNEASTESGRLC